MPAVVRRYVTDAAAQRIADECSIAAGADRLASLDFKLS
jgi:hypothetical protein